MDSYIKTDSNKGGIWSHFMIHGLKN